MAPKRKKEEGTRSIIDAFNAVKKQAKLSPRNAFEPNEIIDITESQEENEHPSLTTVFPPIDTINTVKTVPKWNPVDGKIMKKIPSSVRRSMIPSVSDCELREMGCDVEELKYIQVNSSVECIQEDIQLVRELISSNCAIVHPKRACFILSLFLSNWLRIFPVGRICISSAEDKWFEALKEECSLMGIEESSFTHIDQGKIPPSSRLMLTNNRILPALISNPLASQIRCIIFYLLGSKTPDKLKSAVNEMLLKKIDCRFIVIGGGGSNGGKTSAISQRQTIITTLHLSKWIEPTEELFISVIKPRLEYPVRVWTWSENDNPQLIQIIDQMEEVVKELIVKSGMDVNELEGFNPRDLIFAPLNILSYEKSEEWEDVIRLLSIFYHLFSFGKTAFQKRLAGVATESEELEIKLLSCIPFTRLIESINQFEGDEHRKIKLIKEIIHKAVSSHKGEGKVKGIIVVDCVHLVESMTECLTMRCQLIGMNIYPMGSPNFPLSRTSFLLQSGGVAIISIHNEEGINAFQTITSSHLNFIISTSRRSAMSMDNPCIKEWHFILHQTYERIRQRIEEEERTFEHERIESAFQLQTYRFHYERSSLPLNVSSAVIRLSKEKGKVHLWNGVSLNPTERSILSSRNIKWRSNRLDLTLTPSSLLWNESLHSLHPSSLSHRLVSSISPFVIPSLPSFHPHPLSSHHSLPPPPPPNISSSLPCSCTPSDGQVFYSSLVSKLSHLFT
ncbi:fncm-1 [Pristionchus pacificus]|uniref:Uncharacterized protein n=1 Tax=Pristionchus pacificus TaxID=54126 RepID=A0A8R1V4W1_PRIPA|nr:fncm-1 [Pristionchus pacificus]